MIKTKYSGLRAADKQADDAFLEKSIVIGDR